MSREVTGSTADDGRPPVWRAALARPVVRGLVAAAAVAALAATAVLAGADPDGDPADGVTAAPSGGRSPGPTADASQPPDDLPVGEGLVATVVAAGEPVDLRRVDVTVTVLNAMPDPRRLVRVELLGVGAAVVEPADGLVAPAGGSVRLDARVTADCAVLARGLPRVRVVQRDDAGGQVVERASLADAGAAVTAFAALCPAVEPGLRVAVAASRPQDDGTVAVRVVNHGTRSALVTPRAGPDAGEARLASDPPLPYDLAPGEALVARLRVTGGCPDAPPAAAAEVLFLEAEVPDGFTAVTGFPTGAVRAVLERRAAALGCPATV